MATPNPQLHHFGIGLVWIGLTYLAGWLLTPVEGLGSCGELTCAAKLPGWLWQWAKEGRVHKKGKVWGSTKLFLLIGNCHISCLVIWSNYVGLRNSLRETIHILFKFTIYWFYWCRLILIDAISDWFWLMLIDVDSVIQRRMIIWGSATSQPPSNCHMGSRLYLHLHCRRCVCYLD